MSAVIREDTLFANLARLRQAWPKRGWTWDSRLSCVASAFGVELTGEARAAIRMILPQEWNAKTLATAPAMVQTIASTSGGLRADQLLYLGDATETLTPYALWWPWGDETTITLRVGLAGIHAVRNEFQLRDTFNALD